MTMKIPTKVSVRWQCVFAFLPIINLWAAYRIRKLRRFLLLSLILTGINIIISLFIPFPYSLPISWAVDIPVRIHYMRKWSTRWNDSLKD